MSQDEGLGPCCECGRTDYTVRNIVMLSRRGPNPGKGWGCVVCHLPLDGAVSVLCDVCIDAQPADRPLEVKWVCAGDDNKGRMPFTDLSPDVFDHNFSLHPEAEGWQ